MRKRRKARSDATEALDDAQAEDGDGEDPTAGSAGRRVQEGPWDSGELVVEEDDETRANLGSLSVVGNPDVELRLQVDEASGRVDSVLLVAADGAMELRAFAAPRNEDLWDDIRPRIASEATRMGGTATEVDGPFGTALQLLVPGVGPDGQQGVQPSTVFGISGPRWLLRVSTFGRPAVDYRDDGLLETTLRSVVVTRGNEPMAPGDALPLQVPSGARRIDGPF
ncbi:MAG: hypothetical protein QOK15_3735 [Nocardioidaceae bacterium]|jgi:hypothetical protein|nr:hypothetical protein [Nocardioidaceae bacterium]